MIIGLIFMIQEIPSIKEEEKRTRWWSQEIEGPEEDGFVIDYLHIELLSQ